MKCLLVYRLIVEPNFVITVSIEKYRIKLESQEFKETTDLEQIAWNCVILQIR